MNMPTRGQRTAKNKMKKVMGEYKEGIAGISSCCFTLAITF